MSTAPPGDGSGRRLRVLVAHNAYREAGGEDSVVASEIALLQSHGHTVETLRRDNASIGAGAGAGRVRLAAETVWSARTHAAVRAVIERFRPDVLHVHNTLPLLSPSLHWAGAAAGVAVVQTLHNFRLACPQAMFLRDGKVCEDCLGRAPWPAIVHSCYRGSRVQSAVVAGMIVAHRAIGTWERRVDRFIALTEFSRNRFVAAGMPVERLVVKPNFIDAVKPPPGPRGGFLFVGRLAVEKGIGTLAKACAAGPGAEVRVVGTGPESDRLRDIRRIRPVGALTGDGVLQAMAGALALIVPSLCYETFGRVVVEAYASGLPVIASRIGSLAELVEEGVTGLLFAPGDAADLARAMAWAESHPQEMAAMGRTARERYEARYTGAVNHRRLMEIYRDAMADRAMKPRPS